MELLQNYGPYLLIGIVMFLMIRKGGCCGGHGGHSDKNESDDKSAPKKSCH
jgi:copper chaperone